MKDSRLDQTWAALRAVVDPEIGLDVVTLGLVYEVTMDGDVAHVTHTLTTRGCPMEQVITQGIQRAAGAVSGIGAVQTHLVWDPVWHAGMIDPNAWNR